MSTLMHAMMSLTLTPLAQAISPNWHVILIHYPIALVMLGLGIEIFAFLYRRSSVRMAARWMILFGSLSCIVAMTTGLYAFRDIASARHGLDLGITVPDENSHWQDVKLTSPLNDHHGQAWDLMKRHIVSNAIGTGLLVLAVVAYLGCSDRKRQKLYPVFLLLVMLGAAGIAFGAWNGGEAIYRLGAGVQTSENVQTLSPAADGLQKLQFAIPPLQLHVLLAGVVIAMGMAALGLSIRGFVLNCPQGEVISTVVLSPPRPSVLPRVAHIDPMAEVIHTRTVTTVSETIPGDAGAAATYDVSPAPRGVVPMTLDGAESPTLQRDLATGGAGTGDSLMGSASAGQGSLHRVPAPTWWMLAMLCALATATAGLWAADTWSWKFLRSNILPPMDLDHVRLFTHVVSGTGIIVLTLMLALVTRWSRNRRWPFSILAFLLILAIAAQVWTGVLMLYDGNSGSVRGWTLPKTTAVLPENAAAPATLPSAASAPIG